MDAVELLRSDSPFIADTSAWWRVASLPSELGALFQAAVIDDRLWITPIVRMEILYSARSSSEYVALETELDALRIVRDDRSVTTLRCTQSASWPSTATDITVCRLPTR